eukprot:TRINITY_DN6714_c0_g2_i1.p1 TRINITY_DN6714_c0_g2~~TRINITY_DN6714_c0_g2_i1.p1  ORF type:complete len:143 (-),score=9.07 TRINITY_DN6714_c0_g2_i1:112-540(-)
MSVGDGESQVSSVAADFINGLLERDPSKRLDAKGIKSHDFFKGLDWNNLRNEEPPFVPQVADVADTSYFDSKKGFSLDSSLLQSPVNVSVRSTIAEEQADTSASDCLQFRNAQRRKPSAKEQRRRHACFRTIRDRGAKDWMN